MGKLLNDQKNQRSYKDLEKHFVENIRHPQSPHMDETVTFFTTMSPLENIFFFKSVEDQNKPGILRKMAREAIEEVVGAIPKKEIKIVAKLFIKYVKHREEAQKEWRLDSSSELISRYIAAGDLKHGNKPSWIEHRTHILAYFDTNGYLNKAASKEYQNEININLTTGMNTLLADSKIQKGLSLETLDTTLKIENRLDKIERETGISKEEILSSLARIDKRWGKVVDEYRKNSKLLLDLKNQQNLMQKGITGLSKDYAFMGKMIKDLHQHYLEEKKEKIQQRYKQMIALEWQRLKTSTHFLSEVAHQIGNKDFIKMTNYAKIFSDNAEPIFDAFGLSKYTDKFMLSIDGFLKNAAGIANVGMAVLFIAQLFSKKEQPDSFETVAIQYLQMITEQLKELQSVMNAQFARMNDKLLTMHNDLLLGFRDVFCELQANHIYTANRFDKLEAAIFEISQILKTAIQAFWLRPLIRTFRSLENDSLLRTLNPQRFNTYSDELILWITGESTDSLSTGEFLAESALAPTARNVLKNILKNRDVKLLIGFLQKLCTEKYGVKLTNEAVLYNPAIWLKSAYCYLQMNDTLRLNTYDAKLTKYLEALETAIEQQPINREHILNQVKAFVYFIEDDSTLQDDDLQNDLHDFQIYLETTHQVTTASLNQHFSPLRRLITGLSHYAQDLIFDSQDRDKDKKEILKIHESAQHILKMFGDIRQNKKLFTTLLTSYKTAVSHLITEYDATMEALSEAAMKGLLDKQSLENVATVETIHDLQQSDTQAIKNINIHGLYHKIISLNPGQFHSTTQKNSAKVWNQQAANWNAACDNQIKEFFNEYEMLLNAELSISDKGQRPINNVAKIMGYNNTPLLLPLSNLFNTMPASFDLTLIKPLVLAQKLGIGDFDFVVKANSTSDSFTINVFFILKNTTENPPKKYPIFQATLINEHKHDSNLDHADHYSKLGSGAGDGQISINYQKATDPIIYIMRLIHGWKSGRCSNPVYDSTIHQITAFIAKLCDKEFAKLYKETLEKLLTPDTTSATSTANENILNNFRHAVSEVEINYLLIVTLCKLAGFEHAVCEQAKKLCHEQWIYDYAQSSDNDDALKNVLTQHIQPKPKDEEKKSELPYFDDVQNKIVNACSNDIIQDQSREKTFTDPLQIGIEKILSRTTNLLASPSNAPILPNALLNHYQSDYDGVLDSFYGALFYDNSPHVNNRYKIRDKAAYFEDHLKIETLSTIHEKTEYFFDEYTLNISHYDLTLKMTRTEAITTLTQLYTSDRLEFQNAIRLEAALSILFGTVSWKPPEGEETTIFNALETQAKALLTSNLTWIDSASDSDCILEISLLGSILSYLISDALTQRQHVESQPQLKDLYDFIIAQSDAEQATHWEKLQTQDQYSQLKIRFDELLMETLNFVYQPLFQYFTHERCLQYIALFQHQTTANLGILSLFLVYKHRNTVSALGEQPIILLPLRIWSKATGDQFHLLSKIGDSNDNTEPMDLYWYPDAGIDYHVLYEIPKYLRQKPLPVIGYQQQQRNNRLLEAASMGNVAEMTAALNDNADIQAVDAENKNALFLASEHGHQPAVEFLLTRRLNSNYHNNVILFENKPRYLYELLQMLNLNLMQSALSPILLAAREGHHQIISLLINASNNPAKKIMYTVNHMGISPILAAAAFGRNIIEPYFSKHIAHEKQNTWMLDLSVAFNHRDNFNFLLTKMNIELIALFPDHNLFYLFAAAKNHFYLKYVLANLAVNDETKQLVEELHYQHPQYGKLNLLMYCVIHQYAASVHLLIHDQGMNKNLTSSLNKSALVLALSLDALDSFKILFEAKATFNKETLLKQCADQADHAYESENLATAKTDVIRYIYRFGNEGHQIITHLDLLFAACKHGSLPMLMVLIDEGIDLGLIDTAIQSIKDSVKQDILDYLDYVSYQKTAAYTGNVIQKLLIHTFEPNNTAQKQTMIIPTYHINAQTIQQDHDNFIRNLSAALFKAKNASNQHTQLMLPICIEKNNHGYGNKMNLWILLYLFYSNHSKKASIVYCDPTGNGQDHDVAVDAEDNLIKEKLIERIHNVFQNTEIPIDNFAIPNFIQISLKTIVESAPILIENAKAIAQAQEPDTAILNNIKNIREEHKRILTTMRSDSSNLSASSEDLPLRVQRAPAKVAPKNVLFNFGKKNRPEPKTKAVPRPLPPQ